MVAMRVTQGYNHEQQAVAYSWRVLMVLEMDGRICFCENKIEDVKMNLTSLREVILAIQDCCRECR